jgi:hypothetical protein
LANGSMSLSSILLTATLFTWVPKEEFSFLRTEGRTGWPVLMQPATHSHLCWTHLPLPLRVSSMLAYPVSASYSRPTEGRIGHRFSIIPLHRWPRP